MTETRATARLPRLEIEIRHREVPEEGAEYLSVSLKAMPGIDAAAAWFHPMGFMLGWLTSCLADAMTQARASRRFPRCPLRSPRSSRFRRRTEALFTWELRVATPGPALRWRRRGPAPGAGAKARSTGRAPRRPS